MIYVHGFFFMLFFKRKEKVSISRHKSDSWLKGTRLYLCNGEGYFTTKKNYDKSIKSIIKERTEIT